MVPFLKPGWLGLATSIMDLRAPPKGPIANHVAKENSRSTREPSEAGFLPSICNVRTDYFFTAIGLESAKCTSLCNVSLHGLYRAAQVRHYPASPACHSKTLAA